MTTKMLASSLALLQILYAPMASANAPFVMQRFTESVLRENGPSMGIPTVSVPVTRVHSGRSFATPDTMGALSAVENVIAGGKESVTFTGFAPALAGLTIDQSTGRISGMISDSAERVLTAYYQDSDGKSGQVKVPINIYPVPTLSASRSSVEIAVSDDASALGLSVSPSNNGFYGGVTYSLSPASSALPDGLSLNASTGAITGILADATEGDVAIVIRGTSLADPTVFAETQITLKIVATPAALSIVSNGVTTQEIVEDFEIPAFSATAISVEDGSPYTAGLTWSLKAGTMPPGVTTTVSADSSTLTFGGYATSAGEWNDIIWTATTIGGRSIDTGPVSFNVTPRPELTLAASQDGTIELIDDHTDVSLSITASNVAPAGPISWQVTGNVPPGIQYSANGDALTFTGKATASGLFDNVQISATDAGNDTTTADVAFNVAPNFGVTLAGSASQIITLEGRAPALSANAIKISDDTTYTDGVTWQLISGTLPAGITATPNEDGSSLVIGGSATELGLFPNLVWSATDGAGNQRLTAPASLEVIPGMALNASATSVSLMANTDPADVTITATNVAGGKTLAAADWTVDGLPSNLNVAKNGNTLRITGTPDIFGSFVTTVTADDGMTARTATIEFTIVPFTDGDTVAGRDFSCRIATGGAVECWGDNANGKLGSAGGAKNVPTLVTGLTANYVSISTGQDHACALHASGELKCWGGNAAGQLGDGSTTGSTTPVTVAALGNDVAAVTAGYGWTCAITKSTGAAKCWGGNNVGQLGNNSTTNSPVPVQVSGLTEGVKYISAGSAHTCAINKNGGAMCWGVNQYGGLGNNSTANSSIPVQVSGLETGVSTIKGGFRHTCALTTSGAAKCWGYNNVGQLGNNSTTNSPIPVQVTNLTSGTSKIGLSEGHVCAVKNGAAFCWGFNNTGQVGNNTTADQRIPAQVSGLTTGVKSISAGYRHTCVSMEDKTSRCWGLGTNGQLGNGANLTSWVPVVVN